MKSKKAVSAVVAAVFGIGLLFAWVESAQAQSGIPEVTEFYFVTDEVSDYDLNHGWRYLPVLDKDSAGPEWDNEEYSPSDNGGGYYSILFWPEGEFPGSGD